MIIRISIIIFVSFVTITNLPGQFSLIPSHFRDTTALSHHVNQSDYILLATIIDKKELIENDTFPFPITVYTLEIDKQLKGEEKKQISIVLKGGRSQMWDHTISLRVGDEGLFFLRYWEINTYQVLMLKGRKGYIRYPSSYKRVKEE